MLDAWLNLSRGQAKPALRFRVVARYPGSVQVQEAKIKLHLGQLFPGCGREQADRFLEVLRHPEPLRKQDAEKMLAFGVALLRFGLAVFVGHSVLATPQRGLCRGEFRKARARDQDQEEGC